MLIVTANIRNNPDMPAPWVRDDARLVRRLDPGLVGWQEIGELEDEAALDAAFTPDRYVLAGRKAPCPVTVDIDRYDVLAEPRVVRLTDGDRSVPQPARYAVVVDLEERARGVMLRHINCHLTNGAYHGLGRGTRAARRALWDDQFAQVRALVREAVSQDFLTVLTGDFNRSDMPTVHPRLTWAAGRAAIDRIGVVSSTAWAARPGRSGRLHGHTDHPMRWAQVAILPRAL